MTNSPSAELTSALHLARWTINSGSHVISRGAVVIASGEHQWEASAEGNGPIDALFRAVDRALQDVLAGHPQLLSYEVDSLGEGPDAIGRVRVAIAPPASAAGARSMGRYSGESMSPNIIAASIEAYIHALNLLLGEEHWSTATEDAGNRRRARREDQPERAEIDHAAGELDTTDWFNRSPR